jgi:hypothetical protein
LRCYRKAEDPVSNIGLGKLGKAVDASTGELAPELVSALTKRFNRSPALRGASKTARDRLKEDRGADAGGE